MVIASMSSRIEAFAQLLTLLIIFIFVLAVTYYVTRFVGNYQKNKLSGSNINILETMRIANNKIHTDSKDREQGFCHCSS